MEFNDETNRTVYHNEESILSSLDDQDNQDKKKENPNACIFVASLNKEINDDELHSSVYHLFEQWGPLLSVKVFKDWLKRPYAFVQYEFVDDSKVALREAPGNKLNGRHIRCEPARVNRSICLISLNHPFNKKFISSQLSCFGEIENITNLQPHGKFHSVFIKYKYREDAIKAYLSLKFSDTNNSSNDQCTALKNLNHQWFIEWAANLDIDNPYGICGTSYRLDKTSIFIGNLAENVEEQDLVEVFGVFGHLINVQIIRKPNHHHSTKKVFAFIKYKYEKNAADAIEHQNGVQFKDKVIRVCYRQHQTKPTCTHNPSFLPIAPYSVGQLPDQLSLTQQQNPEDYAMTPFVCYPYNSMPPMFEPYVSGPDGKLMSTNLYQNLMDLAPYYPCTDDQSTISSPAHSPASNSATIPPNVQVTVPPNANYGYYLNSYPTMIYYNYSPYYQVNASVVKKM